MLWNRSIPRASVIPVLAYPDANAAAAWLCEAFGFSIRLRVNNHRVQLNVGDGAVIVREIRDYETGTPLGLGHNVTVRVEDVDAHCGHARAHGAAIAGALRASLRRASVPCRRPRRPLLDIFAIGRGHRP